MKVLVDHKEGQYRSQLFEELVYELLLERFPEWEVSRNVLVPKKGRKEKLTSTPVDFVARTPAGDYILIEAKAPYTGSPSYGINRTLRRLKSVFDRMPQRQDIRKVILTLASELPTNSEKELLKAKEYFAEREVEFELLDSKEIKRLLRRHLNLKLSSFATRGLELALGRKRTERERKTGKRKLTVKDKKRAESEKQIREKVVSIEELRSDEYKNAIVVCADFCSYSRFVSASFSDKELVISIMSRFYREVRRIIEEYGGIVDKFMGDGVLFYWLSREQLKDLAKIIDCCISQLIGISMNLAGEWQDHLDVFVKTKGMRCGGAIGDVLLITEKYKSTSGYHAIGDCINLASRLVSKTSPNSFLISNRLKTKVFGEDGDFEEITPFTAKNIGLVKAWKKRY